MCCCCPSAISALFCLWCQSGCSKGSVAGALTFFPPEPPLYQFEKRDVDGNIVVNEVDDSDSDDSDNDDDYSENSGGVSGAGSNEMKRGGNPNEPSTESEDEADKKRKAKTSESGGSKKSKEKMKSPAQQLVEKNQQLRRRAKKRNARDALDAELGIQYKLVLDPRLAIPPYDETNVTCVKIPAANGIHVAAIIYKCPPVSSDLEGNDISPSSIAGTTAGDQHLGTSGHPSARSRKTIIYSHGNATDIGAMFPLQAILAHSLDCNVVMYDYSGYGESGGIPLENNTYRDIEAVYEYVLENVANNDPSSIILYGQSVGSGPCCHLASRGFIGKSKQSRVGGLVLHSPFTSGMRVLTPSRLLACLDIYPNIDRIKHVKCPVMVIHGRLDEEVEIYHGFQLHNAVRPELQRDPWWVSDRGHNDITEGPGKLAEYLRRLRDYLSTLP